MAINWGDHIAWSNGEDACVTEKDLARVEVSACGRWMNLVGEDRVWVDMTTGVVMGHENEDDMPRIVNKSQVKASAPPLVGRATPLITTYKVSVNPAAMEKVSRAIIEGLSTDFSKMLGDLDCEDIHVSDDGVSFDIDAEQGTAKRLSLIETAIEKRVRAAVEAYEENEKASMFEEIDGFGMF